jgi:hypothetical protein
MVLLIALISHTLPAVIVFIAVFIGLRKFVGGYYANSHLSCMITLVIVMLFFFLRHLQYKRTICSDIQYQLHNDSFIKLDTYSNHSDSISIGD